MSFYNTIGSTGEQLNLFVKQAATQEQRIFYWFKKTKRGTALEAADALDIHQSSARRACHNLAKKNLIQKSQEMKTERYGKNNHIYVFVELTNNC